MDSKLSKGLERTYIFCIFAFLYVPIAIIIMYSFNAAKSNVVFSGFTLDWYTKLFTDDDVITALVNSLTIATLSTIISAIIGTLGAIGLKRHNFKGKGIISLLVYIPIVIPEIIMGVSLLILFSTLQIDLGIFTLVLAHTTFCTPFVFINVKSRLAGLDLSIEDAAMDLGASKLTVFRTITFPMILPAVLSGAMLAFALSLDDIIINIFLSGPASTTLPIKIFSMLKFGLSPEINALCTIMLVTTFAVLILSQVIKIRREK
ncbi:ABC transporter permease [Clostridium estertheticum]|uniref:ABC transporter permease n=2 Tax=Clostridium estertheticum TaxID=238834 RepID=A0A1J0GDE8_9CLOT|nr:ABC transporter permease subunit [Clostridium estertheticum]APC39385.1 ABC transporter permease [Clostridium estertheticum subsp. estertheticum]MBZ9614597.1 ABC transporter permease subunit [Clostridium estertheticum subsp. laramiense]MPQ30683.1 ABC transporter permease subunit [Clostridium estertheticum]MPQ61359.1 ABC transporter permease subunit [Clostridium estertheticum]WAG74524.1 ABC transporter permease subunit [Clostridium estertheticum]